MPLVLIGMIATTYTFVNRVATDNNLDVGPVEEQVQEDVEPNDVAEDTTTTSTTTTLPVEVVSYLEESLQKEYNPSI